MRDDPWKSAAACRGSDVDFFSAHDAEIVAALDCCAGCAVRERCLETAMREHEEHGVWGGTTERQRRRTFRQQARRSAAA